MKTALLSAILVLAAAGGAWSTDAVTARRFLRRAARGESLDAVDRSVAAEAYRLWQESEHVPGAVPGDPALGRALRKLGYDSGRALSPEERVAVSRMAQSSKEETSRRGPLAGGVPKARVIEIPGGKGLGGYAVPISAGIAAVAGVTALGAVRMGRRKRQD